MLSSLSLIWRIRLGVILLIALFAVLSLASGYGMSRMQASSRQLTQVEAAKVTHATRTLIQPFTDPAQLLARLGQHQVARIAAHELDRAQGQGARNGVRLGRKLAFNRVRERRALAERDGDA